MKISRQAYSELYGPTVGDSIRLGDTNSGLPQNLTMRFQVRK